MRRLVALAGPLAALLAAPPALAAPAEVRAVDDLTPASNNVWSPSAVSVNVGETVTWRFDGTTLAHNVKSTSANWNVDSPASTSDPAPVVARFDAEGTYTFVCEFHASTMSGTVTVGNPPPPPPPPLSEQPFVNDQPAPVLDTRRPAVERVRASARRRGARIRFRLTERSAVAIKAVRGKRTVARRVVTRGAGTHAVTFRGLRSGRYRIELRATDLDGNRSPLRRTRVTVR